MATGVITNRLLDPSGNPLVGVTVNARLMPLPSGFRTSSFYEISQLATTTTDSNGDWQLVLEINANINPGDSYWEIVENIPVTAGPQRVWSVQVGTGTNNLYASLVSTPPYQPVPSYITQSSGDARYQQFSAVTLGSIQAVGTATQTGTATTAASSNHIHPLNPSVIGTGLALTAGVVNLSPLTNSSNTAGYLFTLTNTATATGGISQGQIEYNSASTAVFLYTGVVRESISPAGNPVATAETTTNTSYVNLATAGPSVTMQTGPRAIVIVGARLDSSTTSDSVYMSYAVSGATTIAAADTSALEYAAFAAGVNIQASYVDYVSNLTPGFNTFTAMYRTTGGTATYRNRRLIVIPVP